MGLTIGEIVSMPHLGMTVRAGATGLDRDVEWAHVCELEDPTRWLEGPGLVLTTGMAIPAQAARQHAYVQRLAAAGIRAVAIANGMYAPRLTGEMLAAADELAFPVLEVAYEVPYLAITSLVTAANRERSQRRILSYLRIFDTLREATSRGLAAPQLFERLGEVSGYQLGLCAPSGRALIAGIPGAPPGWEPPPASRTTTAGSDSGQLCVPVPLRCRVAGYLLAVPLPGKEALGLLAARHIATIAALELANLQRERESVRRQGAETLGEMLSGMLDAEAVRSRLRLAGFADRQPLQLAAVSSDAGRDPDLAARLLDSGIPHLLLQQRELYVLLQPLSADLGFLAATPGSHAGVSRPFRARRSLEVPRREALWALRYARSRRRALVEYASLQAPATWLPAEPAALAGIVDDVLGPLAAHDAEHGTQLQRTLLVLLDNDRNIAATAHALGVHRNTILQRIARAEAITGRDLRKVQDLAEIWLAASAQELLQQDGARQETTARPG